MHRWYAIHARTGHEQRIRRDLEHRALALNGALRRIEIPTEQLVERNGTKMTEKTTQTLPGYIFLHMDDTPEAIDAVLRTTGVSGFVGAQRNGDQITLMPLSDSEVKSVLKTPSTTVAKQKTADFEVGQLVKITKGALADLDGEVIEVNEESKRLRLNVSIFERQVPTEVDFADVRRID